MKITVKKIFVLSFIYFALFFLTNESFRLNQTSVYTYNFYYYMRVVFSFVNHTVNEFQTINEFTVIAYFSILMFCLWFLLLCYYSFSRSYRGLIMQRYFTKKRFIKSAQLRAFINSLFLVAWIWTLSILLFYYKSKYTVSFSYQELTDSIIFMLNLLVYFNICSIMNIYLDFRLNDRISIIIILFITALVLIVDLYIPHLSVLAFGQTYDMMTGLISQIIILIFLNHFINANIKTMDVL